jgi:murein DD-endopeptidase MepM/ murein hydrolase activator NlpD
VKGFFLFALGAVCGIVAAWAWLDYNSPREPTLDRTILPRPTGPQVPVPGPEASSRPVAPKTMPITPPPAAQETTPVAPKVEVATVQPSPVPVPPAPPAPVTAAAPPSTLQAPPEVSPGKPLGNLVIPVAGVQPRQLRDNFNERRGSERHEAMDIMAARGTPVVAVEDGRIAKLFTSKPGGITLYQFDPTEKYAYYYAHLDRYAQGIVEGKIVRKGEIIGYVGSTGNASPDAPHLHFTIYQLGPDKRWWKGTSINPYPYLAAAQ